MNDVTLYSLRQEIATPQTIGVRQVMANGVIDVAAKAKNWPLLHEAVDIKIADQREYLEFWDTVVCDGRPPETVTDRVTVSMLHAQSGISKMQVSRWRKFLGDVEAYHDKIVQAACRKAGLETDPNRVTPNSGEENWFTPAKYIEMAREVMGGIDLDPASHAIAQEVVQAERWYSAADNGLSKPWYGRVWLNPPYSYPAIEQFTAKLVDEFTAGTVTQGVLLTHNCTDTAWFHYAAAQARMLCFSRGRILFYGSGVSGESPLQGQVFYYVGSNTAKFAAVFGAIGLCVEPYRAV